MKKIISSLLFVIAIGFANLSFGQFSYTFSSVGGTYTALGGGTNAIGNTDDDVISTTQNIGFTFNYGCINYTQFKVSSNGWMTFNTGLTGSNSWNDLDGTGSLILAPLWDDLQCRNNVRYQLSGTAPNRILTIEWLNMEWYYAANNAVISFQVKLYETTNVIEFIYRQEANAVNSGSATIGINGATVGQFYSLNGTGASPTASTITETDNLSTKPANGQIYRWTPSPSCSGTPAAGTATPSPSSVCSGSTSTITLTGNTSGCGISYQWQSSPDNSTWTNIGGATATSYVATVTALTYYRCITTCSNGGATATSSVSTVTMNAPTSCYCVSSATSTGDMDILNITLGTINNTSANISLTGTQGTAVGTAGMYSDWRGSAVPVPNLQQGSTNAFSVQIGGGSPYSHRVDVYIDFNQDGDFADAGESIPIFAYANPALPNTTATSITIPITATTGITTMRVVCVESSSSSYCGTYTWGETEDYRINITAAPACTGAPAGGTTISSVNPICPGGTTTLSVTGSTIASGLVYQWQSSTDNVTWINIPGETGITCTVAPLANTYYRRITTCTNSGGSSSNSSSLYETIVLTAACYCPSSATSTSDMDITRVQFGTINNTSATVSLTGSQGTATGTAGMYSNWTASAVPVPNIQQNVATSLTVQIGGTAYSHRVDVYIDLNQDGDFNDVGESYPVFAYANPSLPNSTSVNITIPCYATLGVTTMRIVCVESSTSTNGCGTYTWGETEDYRINITAGGVCSGTPTAGTAVASVATISSCASPTSTLSLTGASTSCGIAYQWQSAPAAGGPWTNIAGATSAYYVASPSSNTYFRCILTCTNSGLSATSSSVLVNVTISIPPNNDCSGATTLTVNSSQTCTVTTAGTVNCSSASPEPNSCWGTADDDVWFKFVATSGAHDITISNVAGSTTDLYHSVYSGTCGSLGTPLVCSDPNTSSVTGLTVGATYYVRVYTYTSTSNQTTTFNICITSQPNCATPPDCNLNYSLSTITHAPVAYNTGTSVTFTDDRFANSYTALGFNFCFDGIMYSDVLISSNGYLIFPSCYSAAPTETSVTAGGYSPYSIEGPAMPNTSDAPRNAILGPWQDIHPGIGGNVRYQTTGTSPNRIFIVKYDDIPMYDCTTLKFSGQIMLYETTNNIEIHIKEKTTCTTFNGGYALLGLHNYNGTSAVVPAGHNYPTNWSETNTAYRFTSNCSLACTTVLPVELASFTAKPLKNKNLVEWVTETEINNDYFVVESSSDMVNFNALSTIKGAGNSNNTLMYQYVDGNPFGKVTYYRLRQVDFDGSINYSKIVAVKSNFEGEANIYPNPAKEVLFLEINTKEEAVYTIRYVNVLGATVQEKLVVAEGNNTYQLAEFKQLKSGIYFVQLINENDEVIKYQKIVKQ